VTTDAASARAALEREVYWLGTAEPESPLTAIGELLTTLERLERQLHADVHRSVPRALIRMPTSPVRRRAKGLMHRLLRPVTRRYDRVNAELAGALLDLAEHVSRLEAQVRRMQAERSGKAAPPTVPAFPARPRRIG